MPKTCRSAAAVLAALFLSLFAAGAARAQITYTSDGLFSAQDRSVWASGPGLAIDTGDKFLGVDWNVGKTFGGIDETCLFGACAKFGAEVGAQTSGRLGVDYALKANSGTFDARYAGQTSITVPTAVTGTPDAIGPVTLGTAFASLASVQTYSSTAPISSVLQVQGPTVAGHLGLEGAVHAFAGAEVCVVACAGPALGPYDFGKTVSLASVNEGGSGTLTVLGQTVSANQSISALGGLVNANIRIPNLDASSAATPGGYAGGVLTSSKRDNIAAVNANIAQIAADASGFPIPLSGQADGFGYNLLQANSGAALDVRQTLSLTPSASGSLLFSSAVTPVVNGIRGALTDKIDFKPGDDVSFLPGQVSSLSIIPEIDLTGIVRNQTDLVINGNVDVKALGLDIAGLTVGPLIDEKALGGDVTSISLLDNTFSDDLGRYLGQPISLDFACQAKYRPPGELSHFEYGVCSKSNFVDKGPVTSGSLVDSYDVAGCSAYFPGDDQFGAPQCYETYSGLVSSPYATGPDNVYLAGDDPLGFAPVATTASTTDDYDQRLLASLGYTPGEPSFVVPPGETAAELLPEPGGSWTLAAAFGGLMLLARRRGGGGISLHEKSGRIVDAGVRRLITASAST